MAQIVLGMGTSHTPMVNADAEDLPRFIELDKKRQHLDKEGLPTTYDELERATNGSVAPFITPDYMARRLAATEAAVTQLCSALEYAKLDTLIVIGDDQKELYHEDNMPGILVYWGTTIRNGPRHLRSHGPDWKVHIDARNYEAHEPKEYPVDCKLGLHLINWLVNCGFDPSAGSKLPEGEGEGHALGFVHKRLNASNIPVVPVILNTYYPPNQPTPKRCYQLGKEIYAAVQHFPGDARVGIICSGGLSHFTVDEELDREVIRALKEKDVAALESIPRNKLNSGSSEIRNWICVAGAVEPLKLTWVEYYPGYRTPAGTGTGMCFATWR